jgi:hypothetical protein
MQARSRQKWTNRICTVLPRLQLVRDLLIEGTLCARGGPTDEMAVEAHQRAGISDYYIHHAWSMDHETHWRSIRIWSKGGATCS